MRIINWNIEWMNNWFVGGNRVAFREDNLKKGITDVDDLCKRVASAINKLDPDILTIVEGPSDIREMKLFVETYLIDEQGNTLFDFLGGIGKGSQKLYTLIKKVGDFKNAIIANDNLTLSLGKSWKTDVDGDYQLENYKFTRHPLVIEGTWEDLHTKLKIVSIHTKSKYVNKGESLWKNLKTKKQFVIEAVKNRRRISCEAMRIRNYLDDLLNENKDSLIIVTGDFNDGPGIDYFERFYLTHNITDILLGSTYYPDLLFKHAFLERVPESQRYTAIFDDFIDDIPKRKILLDHVLVSPALSKRIKNAGIAHKEFNSETDNKASGRQKYVSDHRPVYLDL